MCHVSGPVLICCANNVCHVSGPIIVYLTNEFHMSHALFVGHMSRPAIVCLIYVCRMSGPVVVCLVKYVACQVLL